VRLTLSGGAVRILTITHQFTAVMIAVFPALLTSGSLLGSPEFPRAGVI